MIEFIWSSEEIVKRSDEYWRLVLDIATKFPKEDLIKLAEHICQEQEHHINNGSYK